MIDLSFFSAISISMKYLKRSRGHSLGIYLQDDDGDWLYNQKMSEEGNMECKKRLIYINPRFTSDKQVALSSVLLKLFVSVYSGCYIFYAF